MVGAMASTDDVAAVSWAARATRVGLALEALELPTDDGVARLMHAFEGVPRELVVTCDADVRRLGVAIPVPVTDLALPRRLAGLVAEAAGHPGTTALGRATLAWGGAPRADGWLERSLDRAYTLSIVADETLEAAVVALGASAEADAAAATVGSRLVRLGVRTGQGTFRLMASALPNDVSRLSLAGVAGPDLLDRLDDLSDELQISAAQRSLLRGIHPIYAPGREDSALIELSMIGGQVEPGLTIHYGPQSIDHVLRAVRGLATHADAEQRFGTLVGTVGATRAVDLALRLGRVDPIPLHVTLEVATVASVVPDP